MSDFIRLLQTQHPLVLDGIKMAIWFMILLALFVPLERVLGQRKQKVLRDHFVLDTAYYFINSLLPKFLLMIIFSQVVLVIAKFGPADFYNWVGSLPGALRFALAVVVGEIGAYWGHRLMHHNTFLWRFHAVHHSAEQMDWLVNTRAHPIDMVLTRICGLLPVYLLGLAKPTGMADQVMVAYALFGTFWSFFIHANLRLRFGPLEWLLSTPAFHHWHHTKAGVDVIDKNFAAIFPWVDRIFGTLYLPKHFPQGYGISGAPLPSHLAGQLVHPFLPPK